MLASHTCSSPFGSPRGPGIGPCPQCSVFKVPEAAGDASCWNHPHPRHPDRGPFKHSVTPLPLCYPFIDFSQLLSLW